MLQYKFLEAASALRWGSLGEVVGEDFEDFKRSKLIRVVLSLVFGIKDVVKLIDEGHKAQTVLLVPAATGDVLAVEGAALLFFEGL